MFRVQQMEGDKHELGAAAVGDSNMCQYIGRWEKHTLFTGVKPSIGLQARSAAFRS